MAQWDNTGLLGEYRLNLDEKGRLSVPAAWRHALHELYAPDDAKFIVTRFFEDCLVLYPEPEWLTIQQQLLAMPNEPGMRAFLRQFCASANVCNLDRQGRLLIPPRLRQYAAIEHEVLMVGLIKKLELWSPVRWEAYNKCQDGPLDTHHEYLKQLQL